MYSFWQIRKEKIIAFARSIRSNKRKVLVGRSGDETTEKRKKVDKNKKRKKKREKKMDMVAKRQVWKKLLKINGRRDDGEKKKLWKPKLRRWKGGSKGVGGGGVRKMGSVAGAYNIKGAPECARIC